MRYARFYKAWHYHADHGRCVSWHKRHSDAITAIEKAKAEDPQYQEPSGIQPFKIELSTAGIVGWLNAHFTTDNG